ncbi:MAG: hypothetical protein EBS38_08210, partial [Actinobacteria bacterium]|nr:hypothetical protein [Actinomycetota bacterium]
MDFEHFMHLALEQARNAGAEVPVGAVIVDSNGQVIASSTIGNAQLQNSSVTVNTITGLTGGGTVAL